MNEKGKRKDIRWLKHQGTNEIYAESNSQVTQSAVK
jgi:hypothetical protein